MLISGDKIGAYEVIAPLASGGMGTLYLGRRIGAAGFHRHVAMKVVHADLAEDESFIRMFLDEARLHSRISHPNVVQVEELGEQDQLFYMVMEYVHGTSLQRLRSRLAKDRRRLAPEMAVWIAAQVADGLHAAHETVDDRDASLGIVHRDVSPHNILLSYRGHVKLIDFGVAKARGRTSRTATGTIVGKLRYMAPEQARGEMVDRRTDVFALGIVLWELLTMQRLFDGATDYELLRKILRPKVVPPSRMIGGIPPALDEVVMDALAPSASRRIGSADEFRRRLFEAVPGALACHPTDLSAVLVALMGDAIDAARKRLFRDAGPDAQPEISKDEARRALRGQTVELAQNSAFASPSPSMWRGAARRRNLLLGLALLAIPVAFLAGQMLIGPGGLDATPVLRRWLGFSPQGARGLSAQSPRAVAPLAEPPPRAATPPVEGGAAKNAAAQALAGADPAKAEAADPATGPAPQAGASGPKRERDSGSLAPPADARSGALTKAQREPAAPEAKGPRRAQPAPKPPRKDPSASKRGRVGDLGGELFIEDIEF